MASPGTTPGAEELWDPLQGITGRLSGWMGVLGFPAIFLILIMSAGPDAAAYFDPLILLLFVGCSTFCLGVGAFDLRNDIATHRPRVTDEGIRLLNPKLLTIRNTILVAWTEIDSISLQNIPERRDGSIFFWKPARTKLLIRYKESSREETAVSFWSDLGQWSEKLVSELESRKIPVTSSEVS